MSGSRLFGVCRAPRDRLSRGEAARVSGAPSSAQAPGLTPPGPSPHKGFPFIMDSLYKGFPFTRDFPVQGTRARPRREAGAPADEVALPRSRAQHAGARDLRRVPKFHLHLARGAGADRRCGADGRIRGPTRGHWKTRHTAASLGYPEAQTLAWSWQRHGDREVTDSRKFPLTHNVLCTLRAERQQRMMS